MKPFPFPFLRIQERIYNYRLSRARRIIENTFGILAARFRIFRRTIIAREDVVINVTKATVSLHNFLMKGRTFGPNNYSYCFPQALLTEKHLMAFREEGGVMRYTIMRGWLLLPGALVQTITHVMQNMSEKDSRTSLIHHKAKFLGSIKWLQAQSK